MRLKLASARENVQLLERNIELLDMREQHLAQGVEALRAQLASTAQQLVDMTAARAQAQAECSRYQVGTAEHQLTHMRGCFGRL